MSAKQRRYSWQLEPTNGCGHRQVNAHDDDDAVPSSLTSEQDDPVVSTARVNTPPFWQSWSARVNATTEARKTNEWVISSQSINQSISLFQVAKPMEKHKCTRIYTYNHNLTHIYKTQKTITQKNTTQKHLAHSSICCYYSITARTKTGLPHFNNNNCHLQCIYG